MAQLLDKVTGLLRAHLRDLDTAGLEQVREPGRVIGFVISPKFQGKDPGQRQRMLKRALNKGVKDGKITEQEMLRVGPIVTMTPDEAAIHE